MNRIIVASKNVGKVNEIKDILKELPYDIISISEAGIDSEAEENGKTYEENALIKARETHKILKEMVISDDSGLEVEALNNRPGIHSARYADSTSERIEKLLNEMSGIPLEKRKARFVCVACFLFDEYKYHFFEGSVEGFISLEPSGVNGFGFDPVFYMPDHGKTMAELSQDIKNRISHRAVAFRKLKDFMQKLKI